MKWDGEFWHNKYGTYTKRETIRFRARGENWSWPLWRRTSLTTNTLCFYDMDMATISFTDQINIVILSLPSLHWSFSFVCISTYTTSIQNVCVYIKYIYIKPLNVLYGVFRRVSESFCFKDFINVHPNHDYWHVYYLLVLQEWEMTISLKMRYSSKWQPTPTGLFGELFGVS